MERKVVGSLFHNLGIPTQYELSRTVFNLELGGMREGRSCDSVQRDPALFLMEIFEER